MVHLAIVCYGTSGHSMAILRPYYGQTYGSAADRSRVGGPHTQAQRRVLCLALRGSPMIRPYYGQVRPWSPSMDVRQCRSRAWGGRTPRLSDASSHGVAHLWSGHAMDDHSMATVCDIHDVHGRRACMSHHACADGCGVGMWQRHCGVGMWQRRVLARGRQGCAAYHPMAIAAILWSAP